MNTAQKPVLNIYTSEKEMLKAQTQRTWVGLTDEELVFLHGRDSELDDFARIIEAKLKEKNTA